MVAVELVEGDAIGGELLAASVPQKVYLGPGESVEWATPEVFMVAVSKAYGPFVVDPAATFDNHKAPIYYTIADDGLEMPWDGMGPVYCNPPYGKGIGEWVRKGADTADLGERVVMLVPARVDTEWFHKHVWSRADTVWFIKGRLRFVGASNNGATFPSCLVVYQPPALRSPYLKVGRLTNKGRVIADPRMQAGR